MMENRLDVDRHGSTRTWQTVLFCFYLFFCFFEPYFNALIGASGKYLIFLVIICFFFTNDRIRFDWYHLFIIAWFLLKFASIFQVSINEIVRSHFLSQIGMVALFITMTIAVFDDDFVKASIRTLLAASALLGSLSLFFSSTFMDEMFSDRQVLTLFGAQNDPNDQAAFLLIGIAVALHGLLSARKDRLLPVLLIGAVLLVNGYAIFKTGSRGGLLSLVILAAVALLITLRSHGFFSSRAAIGTVLIAAFCAGLYTLAVRFLPGRTFERLFDFSAYAGGSGRSAIWNNAFELFLENPVTGGGWGAYWGYNGYYNAVHNTFLSVLADGGIVGFLLLFLPIAVIGIQAFRKADSLPLLIFIAGFAPSLFLDAINKRFFWNALIVAMILINSGMEKKEKKIRPTDG